MNDRSTIKDVNAYATVEEYRRAKAKGLWAKAAAIKAANPDLAAQFTAVDRTAV